MLAARTSSSTVEIRDVVKNDIHLTKQAFQSMEQVQELAANGERLTGDTYSLMEQVQKGTSEVSNLLVSSHEQISKQH